MGFVFIAIWATFPHTGLNLCVPPLKCDPKYVYDKVDTNSRRTGEVIGVIIEGVLVVVGNHKEIFRKQEEG